MLVDSPLTWDDARAFCTDRYYDLASVHTEAQAAATQELCLRSRVGGGCKVGLHDDARADTMLDLSGGTGIFSEQCGAFSIKKTAGAMPKLSSALQWLIVCAVGQVAPQARQCTP